MSKTETEIDTKITIHKRKPSDKLMQLINEAVDTGIKLTKVIDQVWEQGAEEGFSREDIAEIVRPIARQKGLNKDQVYYLTHKPQLLEKSKQQFEELKSKSKTRNIPSFADEKPKKLDNDRVRSTVTVTDADISETRQQIPVEDYKLEDLDSYNREFLIKIIHYLVDELKAKTKTKTKTKTKND